MKHPGPDEVVTFLASSNRRLMSAFNVSVVRATNVRETADFEVAAGLG